MKMHRIKRCKDKKEIKAMENKKLNENELEQVNGGLGGRVCIKDSTNTMATQSFCSGCRVRRDGSYSGNAYDCSCSNGVFGSWRE